MAAVVLVALYRLIVAAGLGSPQRKNGKLGGTAESSRNAGGTDSPRNVEGRRGVAVPALEKAAGPDRLDRG
jgi:hypothetical protein